MRRSELLQVSVHCPHFGRTVLAARNGVIDRLVACDESESCRDPVSAPEGSTLYARPFPHGCPVFPQLAK